MNFLQWMGGFIQQTATTNTAGEIAGSIADIRYNHKRGRGIWCLCLAIAGAGGGATLFVLEPTVLNYFKVPVLQLLPFLGNVASTIAVGVIGAWFGGAFGHNVGKETAREYSERSLGHSNTAYTFNDADVQKIIDQNPLVFNYDNDVEQGMDQDSILGLKTQDLQELKNILLFLRSQIDAHRDDNTTAHDDYKFAFLSALRDLNLIPALELFAKNNAKQEVRKQLASSVANYMANVDPNFIAQPAAPRQMNPFHQNDARRDDDVEPVIQARGVAPQRGIELEEVVAATDHIPLKATTLYANLSRYINALNDTNSKKKDITRTKPASTVDAQHPLQNHQKRQLLVQLRTAYHTQQQKQANVQPLAEPLARTLRSGRRYQ